MTQTLAGPSAHTKLTSKTYRLNARSWAKKFQARLLEPGLVSYEDSGCGVALLKKETLDRCINTFVGRPVVVRHKKTTPANMKSIGHGYISRVFHNETDGWWYGEGVVDTDEAAAAIQRDGFGSVGYTVTQTKPGGQHHAIPYHEEITDFSGEHLAIVDNPRYEGATIRLNSKKPKTHMFKLFKSATRSNAVDAAAKEAADKLAAEKAAADAAAAAARENSAPQAEDISPDTEIEVADGEKVTLGSLVELHNSQKDGAELADDSEVMVDDKPVKLNDLVAAFKEKHNTKAPAAPEGTDGAAAPVKPVAKSKSFLRLTNAKHTAGIELAPGTVDTTENRIARGAARYGKK